MIRETALIPSDTALADRQSIDAFQDAHDNLNVAVDALSHFLANEIAKSEERTRPCICGHISMFCACTVGEDIFGDGK